MRRLFTLVSTTLIFFILSTDPSSTLASKSLSEIREERDGIKEELTEAEKEVEQVIEDINEINVELEALSETEKENKRAINEIEREIDELNEEIRQVEKQIEKRFDILTERARSYQASGGDVTYLEVLLGATDFSDFISRVHAITKITDSDAILIEEQETDKEELNQKMDELKGLETELKDIEDLVKDQKKQAHANKIQLEKKEATLENLIEELKIEDRKLVSLEANIIEDTKSVTASMIDGNGILGWPTEGGYISSYMGKRWGRTHKGIDIARTDRSTSPPIYAAESGIVKEASFNGGGYGNIVVIDHGNGLETLYAHLAKLEVKSGEKVEKGSRIGIMGTTGNSSGIHLHFEVLEKGINKNPIAYLR